tara:strand:- start:49552 stop:50043 length:492 start_codon:yes stop_codon:yes gene_type:complete
MAQSKLLLLEPVDKLGEEGDEVTVKAGFARNYLLPRKKALPFSRANRKQMEALQRVREQRKAQELAQANELKEKIEKLSVAFAVKTGKGDKEGNVKLFGSVTANDLVKRLAEEGIEIEKKKIQFSATVKALGQYQAKIKLHRDPEVVVDFTFEVVSENPIEEA